MAEDVIEITVRNMVEADLRGIDSHGAGMLPTYNLRRKNKVMIPTGELTVVREFAATALLDAGNALGHYATTKAMEDGLRPGERVRRRRRHGTALEPLWRRRRLFHDGGGSRHDRHVHDGIEPAGCLADLREGAALQHEPHRRGRAGFKERAFLARYGDQHRRGRQVEHRPARGQGNSHRLGVGRDGHADDGPGGGAECGAEAPLADRRQPGARLPQGLRFGARGRDSVQRPLRLLHRRDGYDDQRTGETLNIGHFCLAIDPNAFREEGEFEEHMDALMDWMRDTPPLDPAQPVLVPGDPEHEARKIGWRRASQ